mgnify:CR=1 FL=1
MYIDRLEIKGFGRISGLSLKFTRGLNIVFGNNESGKSTLQWFITGMFYGLKGIRASRDESLSPLKRLRPWTSAGYGGTLEYCLDCGERYRVERDFHKNSARVFDSRFTDITGSFNIGREKEIQFAEQHLGVSRDCFERTVFVRQMSSRVDRDGSRELLNRLVNIKQTGFEDVSFRRAEKALKEAVKGFVGTDRTTVRPLDKITDRLRELRAAREGLINKKDALQDALAGLDEAKARKVRLESRKALLCGIKELTGMQMQLERYIKQEEELKTILAHVYGDIAKLEEASREFEETGRRREGLIQLLESKKPEYIGSGARAANYFAVVCFLLAAVFAAAGLSHSVYWFFGGLAAVLAGTVGLWVKIRKSGVLTQLKSTQRELAVLKLAYEDNMHKVMKLNNLVKDRLGNASLVYGAYLEDIDAVSDALSALRKEYGELNIRFSELTNELLDKYGYHEGSAMETYKIGERIPAPELKRQEALLEQDLIQTDRELVQTALKATEYETLLKNRETESDNIQKIDEEIEALEVKKLQLENMGSSLRLALDTLTEASLELQKDFAPVLNEKLSSIIFKISGGRYSDLRADESLSLKAIAPETGDVADATVLSDGTLDQAYLALRLAAAQLIEGTGEKLPVLMDEVFAQYDDIRTKETMEYLSKLSRERQIILFTCKSRELDIAEEACGPGEILNIHTI